MDQGERTALIRQAHALENEHQRNVKRAAMLLDAEKAWKKTLNKDDRRNREYILLALKSGKPPAQLDWSWSGFDRNCSMELKQDREIFLERLELESFGSFYSNRAYRVPYVFRNDKHVMLKVVSKNPLALSVASAELRNDRQVVSAALKSKQPCAPQAIKYASKKLRGDRRIVRTVLQHGHGIKALKLLSRKIQQDYDLVLLAVKSSNEECNESYETLSELSEEWLSEADIVLEAVKRRGSNIRFVEDLVLLEDPAIIREVCRNDGNAAVEYCPEGHMREEMFRGSKLRLILESGGNQALGEISDERMFERKYLIPAIEHSGLLFNAECMDDLYENDKELFDDIIAHTANPFDQYYELSDGMRNDFRTCVSILTTNKSIAQDEESLAFHLSKDIADHTGIQKHITMLMKFASDDFASPGGDIWNDKSLVISLCKFDGDDYRHASDELKADPDVARAACYSSVSAGVIKLFPRTLLEENHDIAAMAVKACHVTDDEYNDWDARRTILRSLGAALITETREVMIEWVRKGWNFCYPFNRSIRFIDEKVALEAIKNCKQGDWYLRCLCHQLPNKKILGDKDFMIAAIEANPWFLKKAKRSLRKDTDFMLRVASLGRQALEDIDHSGEEFHALVDCAEHVRDKLAVMDAFVSQFLSAIAIDPPESTRSKRRRTCRGPEPRCHLRMLDDVGPECHTVKTTIAEFAGVPIGSELAQLRTALDTLQFWGY